MNATPYIDQSTLDEAREAHRQGIPLTTLASKLRSEPEHLSRLLGLPVLRPVPEADTYESGDLWAGCDRLDAVL